MKLKTTLVAAFAITTLGANAATTVSLNNINLNSTATALGGTPSTGTFSTTSFTNIPDSGLAGVPSVTYGIAVSGMTIDGTAGYNLNFNLTLTALAGDGINDNYKSWVYDTGLDGGNPEGFRINAGELITFSVSGATVTGPTGATANFLGFDAIDIDLQGGTAVVDLAAGTFTGLTGTGAAGTRAMNVDLSFSISPIPEPSSVALLGLGGLALIVRRRRA